MGRLIDLVRSRVDHKQLIGLDVSEKMIEFCLGYLGADPKVRLHVNDGVSLSPVSNDSVDFAYSVDVFIHIHDVNIMLNYLTEVRRVLKLGSEFRFNARYNNPNRAFGNSWGGRFAKLMVKLGVFSSGRHKWKKDEEVGFNGNAYTIREMKKLVAKAGLKLKTLDCLDDGFVGNKLWVVVEKT